MVMRWDVLNRIAEITEATRYLEIGVCEGETMRQIRVKEKWGVDPYPQLPAVRASDVFVPKTSAEFFRMSAPVFDLVFIDGDHRAEAVHAEVLAALLLLAPGGVIVLHDCNPTTEAMQRVPGDQMEWTGDVWKAVARLRHEGHCLRVIDSDYGIGVLVAPATPILPPKCCDPQRFAALTWEDLDAERAWYLGLLEPHDWEEWFHRQWALQRTIRLQKEVP